MAIVFFQIPAKSTQIFLRKLKSFFFLRETSSELNVNNYVVNALSVVVTVV